MSISDLAYAGLEQAINHHISMDQKAKSEMAKLHGRVIAIEMLGTSQTIYLVPGPDMVQLLSSYEAEPDCLLQGSPMTITQLRTPVPKDGNPIPAEMQISGDQELAEQFCRILRQVEINWEAHLSQYTGSLIAGEVGKVMGFAGYWGGHIVDTLKQDVQELLQQQSAALPTRHEVDGFATDVGKLVSSFEQLEKRVDDLKNNNKKPKGAAK